MFIVAISSICTAWWANSRSVNLLRMQVIVECELTLSRPIYANFSEQKFLFCIIG
jgi:hypothetical protein